MSDFDVVVVGSGAGGGIAAWKFAQRGFKVLVMERAAQTPPERRDPLRNQRYAGYDFGAGPPLDERRVFEGEEVGPLDGRFNNNAMTLGGGTRVFGGQAWRFHPLDFRMETEYGRPAGSSLADWPIHFDELEPYYRVIETELGVSGSDRELPMPPVPLRERGALLQAAADRMGWRHVRIPLMTNSVPYRGRPACIECRFCVGFQCPNGSRAGTHNTVLPIVERTPGCDIWTNCHATRIVSDAAGRVTGVGAVRDGKAVEVAVGIVVVACGAIETARLLLCSPTGREPSGLGNNSDQVGRHLQGHYYPGAQGLFDRPIDEMFGPGATVALTEFNHGNPGIVGGGMLADDFIPLPTTFAARQVPPTVPRYGSGFKRWVARNYLRHLSILGPTQEIPSPGCRVTVDRSRRDRHGMPLAHLMGTTHPETVRAATFMAGKAVEWLRAAGANDIYSATPTIGLSAGQHQAGTCRMGSDAETSVTDPRGRVHGHENLLICDTSVHVTNGGFNPFLTAMALSLRAATLF